MKKPISRILLLEIYAQQWFTVIFYSIIITTIFQGIMILTLALFGITISNGLLAITVFLSIGVLLILLLVSRNISHNIISATTKIVKTHGEYLSRQNRMELLINDSMFFGLFPPLSRPKVISVYQTQSTNIYRCVMVLYQKKLLTKYQPYLFDGYVCFTDIYASEKVQNWGMKLESLQKKLKSYNNDGDNLIMDRVKFQDKSKLPSLFSEGSILLYYDQMKSQIVSLYNTQNEMDSSIQNISETIKSNLEFLLIYLKNIEGQLKEIR